MFPLGSRLNERGRLEVGGCDTIELAREFGTPAYVVAEDDLRARARAFVQAGRDAGPPRLPRGVRLQGVSLHGRAWRCSPRRGCGATWPPGGELHLALKAGFRPERIVFHGNAKSEAELGWRCARGVGLIVVDNFDEIDRLERLLAEGARPTAGAQPVLVRVTPDVRGETHEKISTGQADSKFGFAMAQVGEAIARIAGASRGCRLKGLHAHIGSQLLGVGAVSLRGRQSSRSSATSRCGTSEAAWGCATPRSSPRRRRSRSTSARSCKRRTPTAWAPTGAC